MINTGKGWYIVHHFGYQYKVSFSTLLQKPFTWSLYYTCLNVCLYPPPSRDKAKNSKQHYFKAHHTALIWISCSRATVFLCQNTCTYLYTLHQILYQSQEYSQFMHSVMTKQAHTPSATLNILKMFMLKHGLVNAMARCQY